MANICWSFVWLVILIIIGWPVGFFCAVFYLIFSPFSACIEPCTPFTDLLERGVKFPLTCALNIVHGKAMC